MCDYELRSVSIKCEEFLDYINITSHVDGDRFLFVHLSCNCTYVCTRLDTSRTKHLISPHFKFPSKLIIIQH